jgi:hypothetical protein
LDLRWLKPVVQLENTPFIEKPMVLEINFRDLRLLTLKTAKKTVFKMWHHPLRPTASILNGLGKFVLLK